MSVSVDNSEEEMEKALRLIIVFRCQLISYFLKLKVLIYILYNSFEELKSNERFILDEAHVDNESTHNHTNDTELKVQSIHNLYDTTIEFVTRLRSLSDGSDS